MAASLFGGLFNSLIYHDYDPYLDRKGTGFYPTTRLRVDVFTGSSRSFFNKVMYHIGRFHPSTRLGSRITPYRTVSYMYNTVSSLCFVL
jgi:hypothetical protein